MLRTYLPSVIAHTTLPDCEIIVADNGSTDDSIDILAKEFPAIRTIVLDKNYGFAEGYNRAIAQVDSTYIVLLNSDVEVTEGWLAPLLDYLDTHPEVAAVQPKIRSWKNKAFFEHAGAAGGYLSRLGYPYCRGRRFGRVEQDKGQYDTIAEIDWTTGAAMCVRRDTYESCGGLDAAFFAHMEEIDLCWKMQLRGWKVTVVPQSKVYHIGGGTLPNESPFKLRLNFRNNLLLLENNLPSTLHSRFRTRLRILTRMCLDGLSALVYLFKGKGSFFRAVVQAHREYRRLRTPGEMLEKARRPEGLYRGWIVPIGLFGKK